ncbi:hypothetical protein CPB83DRAFT_906950 [Crepidotus variabilis]|uniref:G domain-containing protein n=1 Tax=Crepidotus variabilis TaxID=179855 RepID=A0A9P6EG10_9AGAR|nr:hypothetical protein CPB83DRAFT_906950 [Crepidotus variabilis]
MSPEKLQWRKVIKGVIAKYVSGTSGLPQGQSQMLDWGDIRENDFVILVVGRAGSGKTTFVNTVSKSELLKVDRGLSKGTRNMGTILCEKVKPRIVLVDTPPHPDEDSEMVLQDWLQSKSRKSKMKINGLIYVHQMGTTTNRFRPQETLGKLQQWGGDEIKDIPYIMVKTRWNLAVPGQDALVEEAWKEGRYKGPDPVVLQKKDDADAGWGVVKLLLENSGYNLEESDETTGVH